ncbi:hypothetical protein MTR67_047344 [Solanum verrucosum]|uniref:Uncharacterized protein n=1 Tax=Solanum verrucosum TaxID=315347 RepID=A0AAF0ZYY1_SOLVR|nr:hypothetical protein MTR67_047344 [Solanum verrucosum]
MKSTTSRGGKKYFVTFIDNCIRNDYVYLLNGKDEAIETSRQYNIEVENQLGKKIRSDRDGDSKSHFAEICLKSGIIHQTVALFTSI